MASSRASWSHELWAGSCLVIAAVLGHAPLASAAAKGSLNQLAGTAGCVSADGDTFEGDGLCGVAAGVSQISSVVVSRDGKHVYAGGVFGVAMLMRDRKTGALAPLPVSPACLGHFGFDSEGNPCTLTTGINETLGMALSEDGRNLYVLSDAGVGVFARDRSTGNLTQLAGPDGCVTWDGSGGTCTVGGDGLQSALSIAISTDGRNAYVGTSNGTINVFSRDRGSGVLTRLNGTDGCIGDSAFSDCDDPTGFVGGLTTSVVPSRDGRTVYVGQRSASADVLVFARDRKSGVLTLAPSPSGCLSSGGHPGCTTTSATGDPVSIAISRNGRNVYVGSFDESAVAVFSRDRRTGAVSQLTGAAACISETGSGGSCGDGVAILEPSSLAVSRNGKYVYVTSVHEGIAAFSRDARTHALGQLPGTDACVTSDGTGGACEIGLNLRDARSVAVSPNGKHVYVGAEDNGIAVFSVE